MRGCVTTNPELRQAISNFLEQKRLADELVKILETEPENIPVEVGYFIGNSLHNFKFKLPKREAIKQAKQAIIDMEQRIIKQQNSVA